MHHARALVRVHAHLHAHVHVPVPVPVHAHVCVHAHGQVRVHLHAHGHVHVHAPVHLCAGEMCVCMYMSPGYGRAQARMVAVADTPRGTRGMHPRFAFEMLLDEQSSLTCSLHTPHHTTTCTDPSLTRPTAPPARTPRSHAPPHLRAR